MPLVLIAVVLYVAYEYMKHKRSGAHPAPQTATLGGQSLPGNAWDNGSTQSLAPPGPCDCPPDGSTLVYANDGGESGALPTAATPPSPAPSYMMQGDLLMSGDDPGALTLVPTTTNAVSAANHFSRVRQR